MDTANSSTSSSTNMEPPRKKRFRAKLDHMSPEEKQQRRKEKNRQAAQTARDRKRINMDRLQEENRRLREENTKLRSQILGNSQQLSVQTNNPLHPLNQLTDSGVSDVGFRTTSSASSYLEPGSPRVGIRRESTEARTMSPDSSYFGHSTISPAPSDDKLIDAMIQVDNEISLVNGVQELVEFLETGSADEASFESAALIHAPQPQVREAPTSTPATTVNSLGWTSIQLMLILLISRIHHRSSGKISCCRKQPMSPTEADQIDPVNYNLLDYIIHTKCMDFRRAAEAIISNRNNVRQQRVIALDFVKRHWYNANLNHRRQQPSDTSPISNAGCLVKVQQ